MKYKKLFDSKLRKFRQQNRRTYFHFGMEIHRIRRFLQLGKQVVVVVESLVVVAE